MLSTERLVKRHEKETGFGRVESLYKSYYILHDGTFLGCNYDCGTRGDDHRMVFVATNFKRNDWDSLHKAYRLLRYMPEGDCVWVRKRQRITKEQQQIIDAYNLEVIRY